MRNLRRAFQLLFFILFLYLFILTTYPLKSLMPPNLFFLLSPLSAAISVISAHRWIAAFFPALALLLTTVLLGRYFCSWICPLGTILDTVHRIFFGGTKNREVKVISRFTKYYILVFILVTSLFAVSPGYLMEPVTIAFRTMTLAFFPSLFAIWKSVGAIPLPGGFPLAPSSVVLFAYGPLFLALFLGIAFLESVTRRFWCRHLCPMGALLGVCSRFTLLQKKVSSACIECGICRAACRTGAIHPGNRDFLPSECVYCFDCKALCPKKAISFGLSKPVRMTPSPAAWLMTKEDKMSRDMAEMPVLSRRLVLASMGGGVLWGLVGDVDYGSRMKYSRLIRPPGALPEREFNSLCLRCGECMKVCVTNGLQPTLMEAGISGMWTPRLIPLRGYCEESCNFCSQVCPSGAIRPIEVKEKKNIAIGKARIDSGKCIAWYEGMKCLVCDEHCSYRAIYWKEIRGTNRPFVDVEKCVGCGICENKCPTGPDPAIVVYATGDVMKDIPL
ncbi:MAG: 4Fe-4S dicluster domain-containing protein [Vulcanimicrobiota bacterium]